MFAAFILGLLFWCLRNTSVGAELPAPHRVDIVAVNTNYTLTWDFDQSAAHSHVTFTAQYVAKYKLKFRKGATWVTVCHNTTRRSCDFTESNMHYLGMFVLRVRADLNGRHSNWVQRDFMPDKDAAMGPPSKVVLSPAGSVLDVVISDPLSSTNTSMREHCPSLSYNIVYWEGPADSQASRSLTLNTRTNMVTLPDLKSWTWYCVMVQSCVGYYNKSSSFTPPLCMQTEGVTAWWLIFLYFLGSLVICFIVALLVICMFYKIYRSTKSTFFPSNQLPTHFKEYLCNSPGSDAPRLLTPDSQSELQCDKVTICPQPVLEIRDLLPEAESALLSGLEPDSSGHHSRQGSSGSTDSGVYSTGGNSGMRQPDINQSSGGAETSCWGPCSSEEVKLHSMAAGLSCAMTDEGIVDMSV